MALLHNNSTLTHLTKCTIMLADWRRMASASKEHSWVSSMLAAPGSCNRRLHSGLPSRAVDVGSSLSTLATAELVTCCSAPQHHHSQDTPCTCSTYTALLHGPCMCYSRVQHAQLHVACNVSEMIVQHHAGCTACRGSYVSGKADGSNSPQQLAACIQHQVLRCCWCWRDCRLGFQALRPSSASVPPGKHLHKGHHQWRQNMGQWCKPLVSATPCCPP